MPGLWVISAILPVAQGEKTMAKERLVVIGGDAAGMSAASQARRRRPDLEIVVFERSPHTSYSA
jgi:succinate dehydrogenase/fumarate reductase flavoprotein subunit